MRRGEERAEVRQGKERRGEVRSKLGKDVRDVCVYASYDVSVYKPEKPQAKQTSAKMPGTLSSPSLFHLLSLPLSLFLFTFFHILSSLFIPVCSFVLVFYLYFFSLSLSSTLLC